MSADKVPIPRESWPVIRAFRDHFRMTYAEVGEVLGVSSTRVKQIVNDYESFRRPDGSWSVRPRTQDGA